MASPLKYFQPVRLLKQAWNEIPDIVAGTVLALVSIAGMFGIAEYRDRIGDLNTKRYRMEYTVVRPDDPLARHAPQNYNYDKKTESA